MTQAPLEFPPASGGEHDAARADDGLRLKLVVAYDGTDFHGFAPQRDVRTVAGVLAGALGRIVQVAPEDLDLGCAGRTDAGVHARGQVVSVTVPPGTDPQRLAHAVNRVTGPEVVVRSAEVVPADFDARRGARWRTYRYRILNRTDPDPFLARYAWWIPGPLDLAQLRLAADPLVGEHDFASFCRRGAEGSTTWRRVLEARWIPGEEGLLVFEIRATAFCWQMVRSIVGLLVDAASGRRRPGDVAAILRARDRRLVPTLAPPRGLCLWEVGYDVASGGRAARDLAGRE